MIRFGHDPRKVLRRDRKRVMTQNLITVMTETDHVTSLGQLPGSMTTNTTGQSHICPQNTQKPT
jgi:hypothetical protein